MSGRTDKTDTENELESEPTGDSRNSGVTRRRLLASGAATWATVAVAGCAGGDGDGDDTSTETPTETDAEPTEDDPEPEPQEENYVVTAETWSGSTGVPANISFMSSCVQSNTFVPGMQAVFFVGIFDPETGDRLTNEDIDGVDVTVGDGMETLSLEWSDEHSNATRHDGNNWVASWTVPEDMEPDTYAYTVSVSSGDGNYQDVGVLTDEIQVVEYDSPTNYVVDPETYYAHGSPDYSNGFVGGCSYERSFTPEMEVTFHVGIYDSTNGYLVGSDGLYDPNTAERLDEDNDEESEVLSASEVSDGIDSVTVVSADGSFDDVTLEWTADPDADNPNPHWGGALDPANLDPATYDYEVQISDQTTDRFEAAIASSQFTIIEMP